MVLWLTDTSGAQFRKGDFCGKLYQVFMKFFSFECFPFIFNIITNEICHILEGELRMREGTSFYILDFNSDLKILMCLKCLSVDLIIKP